MRRWIALLTAGLMMVSTAVVAHAVPEPGPSPSVAAPAGRAGDRPHPPRPHRVPKTIDGRIEDWTGTSAMVGGVSAMSAGEFVYQDYIYDDAGAAIGAAVGAQAAGRGANSKTFGTYLYPTDMARYRSNAADLFQLRAARDGDRVAFLVVLNTLVEPDTTVVGIALGSPTSPRVAWPLGAQLSTPADHVLTLWGTGGRWDDTPLADVGGTIAVDTDTNAMEVSLPLSLVGSAFRAYVATGLWSGTGWTSVGTTRSETAPEGGDGTAPNVFNVGFRHDETDVDPAQSWEDGSYWFERSQAAALAAGNVDKYFADVDLTAPDQPAPAVTGLQQVIYRLSATPAPHEGLIEIGVNRNNDHPVDAGRGRGCSLTTLPVPSCAAFSLVGPWQPYAAYVPPGGYDRMSVWLHGGSYALNYTMVRKVQQQLGDEIGAVLVEPVALGPSSWFTDEAQLAVIEAMGDAQQRFHVDPSLTAVGGISMGGYGANRLLVTNPDLFAGGVLHSAAVGDATHDYGGTSYEDAYNPGQGNPVDLLENNRNHRIQFIHGIPDQSAFYALLELELQRLDELGYPHEVLSHPTWQHTTVFTVNDWRREAAFISSLHGDADPPHVTYSTSEAWWRPDVSPGLVFDRAYWVSGLRVRDTSQGLHSLGTVDAVTLGLGKSEPVTAAIPAAFFTGPPAPYLRTGREIVGATKPSPANQFTTSLTNLSAVAFDLARMGVTTATDFAADVTTDGPVELRLVGAAPATVEGAPAAIDGGDVVVSLPEAGTYRLTVGNPPPPGGGGGEPPPPSRGDAGLVTDCGVTQDPGQYSFVAVPPTGTSGTNVTSGDGSARVSSPGTGSYYVVGTGADGVHAYGRRDGSSEVGEPDRGEAHDVTIGPDPWACVAVPAAGVGIQGP